MYCCGVISVTIIFLDHRATKSSTTESERYYYYSGSIYICNLGYTRGKSKECRSGMIDGDCLREKRKNK